MKRILFITQSYPSEKSANVYCDDAIMQQLLKTRDVEIHCLCMRYHNQPFEEVVNGVHVHRFWVGRYFELYYEALNHPGSAKEKVVRKLDKVILRLRQFLTIPIYPCYYPLRTIRFKRNALRLQKEYSFDIVACEHYGYETMMAGACLKNEYPCIRYIQFFWDALSGGMAPGYLSRKFVDSRREKTEEDIFNTADVSVAMLSHKASLLKRPYANLIFKGDKVVFMGIPYLKDVRSEAVIKCKLPFDPSKINIVFAGNLWGRNLAHIAKVLAAVKGMDIALWVITSSDVSGLRQQLKSFDQIINFVPFVEHDELLGILLAADVLLNMGVRNPNAISGKIMEYMGCCKPIISTFAIDDEACLDVLKNYPLAHLVDERIDDFETQAMQLKSFIEESRNVHLVYKDIAKTFFECTPEAYCRLFDSPGEDGDIREQ